MTRPGKNQLAVLDALRRHGQYGAGAGWVWGTHTATVRLLDGLVRHGLATVAEETVSGPGGRNPPPRVVRVYRAAKSS